MGHSTERGSGNGEISCLTQARIKSNLAFDCGEDFDIVTEFKELHMLRLR